MSQEAGSHGHRSPPPASASRRVLAGPLGRRAHGAHGTNGTHGAHEAHPRLCRGQNRQFSPGYMGKRGVPLCFVGHLSLNLWWDFWHGWPSTTLPATEDAARKQYIVCFAQSRTMVEKALELCTGSCRRVMRQLPSLMSVRLVEQRQPESLISQFHMTPF